MRDMLTGALISHLTDTLGVPVVGQTPETRPDRWVLVERVGGVGGLSTDFPMLSLDVWGATKAGASEDAHRLWDHIIRRMPPVIGGVRIIRRVPVSGPTYQPSPSSGGYRYRVAVQLKHQLIQEGP